MSECKDLEMQIDSSEDDSENDSVEYDNEEKIKELENTLKNFPYHYDSYIEIIKLLRTNGELDKLRTVRNSMSEIFPLTEELWLSWIEDEKKLVMNEDDKNNIYLLFDRSMEDYLSVALWVEYCAYTVGDTSTDEGRSKARDTFERALSSGIGLHCTLGKSIWTMYLDFEIAMMSALETTDITDEDNQKKVDAQSERIAKLLKRQLSLPLEGIEKTKLAYEEWTRAPLDKLLRTSYDKALKRSRQLFQFEVTLEKADMPRLTEHQAYIATEMKEGQPARIQLAYERALTDNPLDEQLWSDYIKYMDKTLKISTISLKVHKRAVRNCTWVCDLWLTYARAAEAYNQSHESIIGIYTKAFQMSFSTETDLLPLCLSYCDYLRRRIQWHNEEHGVDLELLRDAFTLCHTYLTAGESNIDTTSSLFRYWALIEAKYCKNIAKSRELWKKIMKEKHGNESSMWIEYFHLEWAYGKHKNCMKILEDGVNSTSDEPELMFKVYIKYCHTEGSLAEYESALDRCESQQHRIEDRRVKANEKLNANTTSKPKTNTKKKEFTKNIEKNKDSKKKNDDFKSPFPVKKPVFKDQKGFKPPGFERANSSKSHENSDDREPPRKKLREDTPYEEETATNDVERRVRTVFVSNLDYKTSDQMLHSLFIKTGAIREVRLVVNITGKSKGYAYVEFVDKASVELALLRDRETINGRPMFISVCKESKTDDNEGTTENREPIFKYSQEMEKNKLFVKGLAFSTTKDSLQKLFSPFGEIKDIRLVTHRTGAFKGLAYIEYVDEKSASKAIMALDGEEINKHKISIAISNPPVRPSNVKVASLGSGKTAIHDRGRAHSMVSFTPRSLGQKKKETNELLKPRMSNNEFRNLLLKK